MFMRWEYQIGILFYFIYDVEQQCSFATVCIRDEKPFFYGGIGNCYEIYQQFTKMLPAL